MQKKSFKNLKHQMTQWSFSIWCAASDLIQRKDSHNSRIHIDQIYIQNATKTATNVTLG